VVIESEDRLAVLDSVNGVCRRAMRRAGIMSGARSRIR